MTLVQLKCNIVAGRRWAVSSTRPVLPTWAVWRATAGTVSTWRPWQPSPVLTTTSARISSSARTAALTSRAVWRESPGGISPPPGERNAATTSGLPSHCRLPTSVRRSSRRWVSLPHLSKVSMTTVLLAGPENPGALQSLGAGGRGVWGSPAQPDDQTVQLSGVHHDHHLHHHDHHQHHHNSKISGASYSQWEKQTGQSPCLTVITNHWAVWASGIWCRDDDHEINK